MRGRLNRPDITISQADGKRMTIMGMVWVPVKNRRGKLYEDTELCEEILGEDCVGQHKD